MRLADANFVLALLLPERISQHAVALDAVRDAEREGETILIGELILGEVCWTLQKSYGWTRTMIADTLLALLGASVVQAWHPAEARQALGLMAMRPRFSVSDCLLMVRSARSGARIETFDRALRSKLGAD